MNKESPGPPHSDWEETATLILTDPKAAGYNISLISEQQEIDYRTIEELGLVALYPELDQRRNIYCRVTSLAEHTLPGILDGFKQDAVGGIETDSWDTAVTDNSPIALLLLTKHRIGNDATPAVFIVHPEQIDPYEVFEYMRALVMQSFVSNIEAQSLHN